MASLASQLSEGLLSLPSVAGITGGQLHLPGFYVGCSDLKSGSLAHASSDHASTTEPSP